MNKNSLLAAINASRNSTSPESDSLLHPAPGQFHPLAVETDMWEAFVLVLERNGDICHVIPGSMDPLKGGPSDILIPVPETIGQYWTLNLGLKQELPADAMLPGFANLTPPLLNYVKYGLNKFELGEPLGDKFRFCLPYIGKNDSRRAYRDELAALVKKANESVAKTPGRMLHGLTEELSATANQLFEDIKDKFKPLWISPAEETYAFAAGKEKNTIHINCGIENHEEILSMKYSPNSNTVWIYIFTSDRSDYSSALDNSEVIDGDGSVLGKIQNGKCILNVRTEFDGSIALRTSDGKICFLKDLS